MEVKILFPEAALFDREKEWNASELLFPGNKKGRKRKKIVTNSRIGSKNNLLPY